MTASTALPAPHDAPILVTLAETLGPDDARRFAALLIEVAERKDPTPLAEDQAPREDVPMASEHFITVDQFAEIFAMRPHMVRRRIRQGRIRAINIGTPNKPEYRISESSVRAFVTANEVRVW